MSNPDPVLEFLKQSNLIENVSDDDSLQQATYAWEYLLSEEKLYHGVILKTHKILMNNQKIRPDERGYYRQRNVSITKQRIIGIDPDTEKLLVSHEKIRDCLPHEKIREEMTNWIEDANYVIKWATKNEPENPSPETVEDEIRDCHIDFENIHPFIDGNGRIGRMLLNWQRVKCGLPILIIWNDEKGEYYKWFKEKTS